MWRRLVKENFWYVIALGVALSITLISVYIFTGSHFIKTTQSQNEARSASLSSELMNLPKVSSIVPNQTSGVADYVATSRLNLAQQIPNEYAPRYSLWVYGLLPAYYSTSSEQAKHAELTNDAVDTLKKTATDLENLKKIIEYMPLVDLGGNFADDPGLGERLHRTQKGLNDAIEYIKFSGFPHEAELLVRLTALNAQTVSLTDETKTAWAAEVFEVQKIILSDIEIRDIHLTKLPEQLRTVYQ